MFCQRPLILFGDSLAGIAVRAVLLVMRVVQTILLHAFTTPAFMWLMCIFKRMHYLHY